MKSFSPAEQKQDSNFKMEGGGRTQGVSTNFVPKLKKWLISSKDEATATCRVLKSTLMLDRLKQFDGYINS